MAGKPITVKILGDAKGLQNALKESQGQLDRFGGKLMGIGKAVAAAGVVAGAAVTAIGVKGVLAFADFEKGMNEVFTLLPGAGQKTFDALNEQTKDFAKEFGVLPTDVIPALYNSLSAGVPEDNVFAFLETAQKAAAGGATDLTTAVDGITSVVNAYGADVMDATAASDLMFTAVRLGKTDFSQLSASLSNVTPIASALGVEFGDVTAALATMTAKGVPTAQATTQLRSLFVELSKAGGDAAEAFEHVAGVSFQQFIDEGGNTYEALEIMQQAAASAGVELQDMFSSVEAGSAALALAGDAGFASAIDEMGSSAGATEAAFEQMDQGLGASFNRIKANIAVLFIEIGEKLAPVVQRATDFIVKNFHKVGPVVDNVVDAFGNVVDAITPVVEKYGPKLVTVFTGLIKGAGRLARELLPQMRKAFDNVRKAIQPTLDKLGELVRQHAPKVEKFITYMRENSELLIPALTALGVVIVAALVVPLASAAIAAVAAAAPILAFIAVIGALGAGIMYAYKNFEGFRNVVDGVVAWLKDTAWPMIKEVATALVEVFKASFAAVKAVIETAIKVIMKIWDGWGKDLVGSLKRIVNAIVDVVKGLLRVLTGVFDLIKAILTGKWGEAWEAIKKILSGAWAAILGVFRGMGNAIQIALTGLRTLLASIFTTAFNAVKTAVTDGWKVVWDFIKAIPGKLWELATAFGNAGMGLGKAILNGIGSGLKAVGGFVSDIGSALKNAVFDAMNWVIDKMNDAIPDKIGMGRFSISLPKNPIPRLNRALGGPAEGLVRVGERGPETVVLPRGSHVLSSQESGGRTSVVNVYAQTNADAFQIGREVGWALRIQGG
jgi:TP901 family phage tail tape measure protein